MVLGTSVYISLPEDQLSLIRESIELSKKILERQNVSYWLSEQEVAARLKISLYTLQQWRRNGDLRFVRKGDVILYRADLLDQDLQEKWGVEAKYKPIKGTK